MIIGTFSEPGMKIGTIGTSGGKLFINAISPPSTDTVTSVSFIE